ncbi:MAG: HAMP domain-containing histidine kinase [Sinobacteraceae bacterium]|nr:HAMP domain-containing histidine kinase [Nevskiaceae bacterium]
MSVVLEFVSAHGGSIQIIDGEFPGAHFRITMPMQSTGEHQPPANDGKVHANAA